MGAVYVIAGTAKVLAMRSGALRGTLVDEWAGGRHDLIVALAVLEVSLGMMLLLDLLPRVGSITLVAMTLLFTTILVVDALSGGPPRACGCFGGGEAEASLPILLVIRNLLIIGALLPTFVSMQGS